MKKYSISIFVSLVILAGCSKFLDVKSDATYVIPNSLEDLQALLDDADRRMNIFVVPSMGESASDNYYVSESTYKGFDENQRSFYVWDYSVPYFGNSRDWGLSYIPVYYSNLVLELLENHERTAINSSVWDNIKGSALFFRSFAFYNLLVQFGPAFDETSSSEELGVVLRLATDFNQVLPRSSVRDCFELIQRDLEESIGYLPDYPAHVMRPSKGAVYALLSRTFLYKRDYSNALKYSDLALALHSELMDFNGDEHVLSFSSSAPIVKFNKETIFYATQTGPLLFATTRGLIDTTLYRSFEDVDLRKRVFFRLAGTDAHFKGNYTGSATLGFGGLSTNEVYLNKAEALAYLGRDDDARSVLRSFLAHRLEKGEVENYFQKMDNRTVLSLVRDERRKELIYRNLRFGDIKRYNMEGAGIELKRLIGGKEYVLEPNSPKYALPLPADWVEFTGNPQNPQ